CERVVEIYGNDRVKGVVTDNKEIECDVVIISVGVMPQVQLAREAGIEIGSLRGITTDERMMTSAEDVYACGDCVESRDVLTGENTLNLLWHNARQQGRVVASNCLGIPTTYPGSLAITTVDVFGTHAASVGSTATGLGNTCNLEIIEKIHGDNYLRSIISDGRVVGAQAIGKTDDTGLLLNMIRKKTDLETFDRVINSRGLLSIVPWYNRISLCLRR
ncbi:FAD-dependent oxidoreductase, partial [Chloroflexota bacterium]